jgi:isocitrate/isopropylmalate dehydrogenase
MMLEHLQEKKAASLLMSAIEEVCRERRHLPIDLGGNSSTGEVTTAVCTALKK